MQILMDHDEFNENVANTTTEVVRNGKKGWLPAKPILLNNWYQFKQRLIAAKAVLKGNAVAVKWH